MGAFWKIIGIIGILTVVEQRVKAQQEQQEQRVKAQQEQQEQRVRAQQQLEAQRVKAQQEQQEQRVRAQQQLEAQRVKAQQEQQADINQMITISGVLISNVSDADKYLDRAKSSFEEGAFSPFLDNIEQAAYQLNDFNKHTEEFRGISSRRRTIMNTQTKTTSKVLESSSNAAIVNKRMAQMINEAQRNFQFATIYEQRKTSSILIAGFQNLGDLMSEMSWRVENSIRDLEASVGLQTGAIEMQTEVTK